MMAAGMEGGTSMAHEIIDFIPMGRENAISRKRLTELCVENDLIDTNKKDKDREMRLLLQKARIDYTILNNPEGGYYRPSREDLQELSRYIRQEEKRAKSIFKDVKRAKRLYEDYKLGRLEQEGKA